MDKAMHSEFEGHTPEEILKENIEQFGRYGSYTHSRMIKAMEEYADQQLKKQKEINERLQKRIDEDWYVVELNKENASLKLELQKLKELNAELVKDKEFLKDMICKVLSIDILTDEAKASVLRQANRALEDDAILRYTDIERESLIKKYKES